MKKTFGIALAVFGCVSCFAEQGAAKTTMTPADRAARLEAAMRKTGGLIERKSEGKIIFVDCQSRIAADEVKTRVDRIQFVLKYPCELRRGTWKFGDEKPADAKVVVFIVDDEKLPMSLVSVEAGWGVVNTATLGLGKRFSKELTRVFCLTAGAANSPVKTSPMQTVRTNADLDKLITDGFTFDMASSINANLKALGMVSTRKTTYLKACEEGWAPAPTNEYQKAIWEKVHAVPATPMKIEFDPKKGR